ncbi:NAD-dependent epimerase/dehydratase family protein [Ralstonia pickettii]|uniref:NAD-dependent epimerase/dehydratase family protein n=1 Tax=Ralstonia pickettii TaxID=329 RepID=A0A7X2HLF5_RALPI|nr:SDR family oxidoreductase [Ralstonia pickettii]MRS98709.1 NAD-dependent epimerase/dehydratase family protein [Ralstonia pickettii]
MILVTGGTGFVGKALVSRLVDDGFPTRVGIRRQGVIVPDGVQTVRVADLSPETDWRAALEGVSAVVHTAARVHVMDDKVADPLAEFRRINVAGTLNLARQAAAVGVTRFVFISSIKVNGEATELHRPFSADDEPAPLDSYGVSKMEAERGLREIASQTGMGVVMVRPPLVYGPGVRANFASMMRWLRRGVPLPLGAVHNARSLVALDNLVDLLVICCSHPAAAGQVFLVSDGEDVSTTELLRRAAQAMGRSAHLVPIPSTWLEGAAALLGKRDIAQRLCGSLQVDIEKTRQVLGWRPPLTLDEGLKKAVEGFER